MNAVVDALKTKDEMGLDRLVQDAGEELAALRRDVARYRNVFDSARLIVGHEFARPLTAVSGYLDLLEEKLGPAANERERGYFAKMRESIERLEDLVESFVQMLRLENVAEDLQGLERTEMGSLIAKVLGRFGESADAITVELEDDVPALRLRRRGLEIVLENLVSNAIKHGGAEGGIAIRAAITKDRRGASNEELLLLSVEDHGPGIPADKIDEVFKPFCRLGNGETDGLGLGLALVKSIITIMGGEISVRSKPAVGTTVTVVIPAHRAINETPDTIG